MDTYGVALALMLASIFFAGIYRAYTYLPYKELKRRVPRKTVVYRRLELVSRHGKMVGIFLGGIALVCTLSAVIVVGHSFDFVGSFVLLALFVIALWYVLTKNLISFVKLAAFAAPYVDDFLHFLDPAAAAAKKLPFLRPPVIRTQIFEKDDLREFLDNQKLAVNNRIEHEDLDNLLQVLEARTERIGDHMVKRSEITFVNAKEPIGPILLSELHKSGHKSFPVQGNSKHEILGILHVKGLAGFDSGGTASNAMDERVYYVNENQRLEHVLQAFTKTGCNIFIVINTKQQVVGLITVNDVLEELLGKAVYSSFDDYGDQASVAHLKHLK